MVLIFILAVIAVSLLSLCIYCFKTCFYASNHAPHDPYSQLHGQQFLAVEDKIYASTRSMELVPFEEVSIKSFDGLNLSGRYYHYQEGAPVKIIFHGYRSYALRDSAGGFCMARKFGMNVLAVDQRAHGKSGGHVITFGILERRDCLSWIQYINHRCGADTPIILSGLSMGAATVVMAASLPLPENVVCVLADCPYSSPKEIICKVCKDEHFPVALAYPFIKFSAKLFGNFDLEETDAVDAVTRSKTPILLLHGEDDRFVPCEMSRKIHASSNGCTQLRTFLDAGHGLSYMVAPVEYEKAVFDFLYTFQELREYMDRTHV